MPFFESEEKLIINVINILPREINYKIAMLRSLFKWWEKKRSKITSESQEEVQRMLQSEIRIGFYVRSNRPSKEDAAKAASIIDGEDLKYECLACGNKFERGIAYGCCCPNKWTRKKILEEHPTVCPACGSTDVKRVRNGFWMGGEPEEWE